MREKAPPSLDPAALARAEAALAALEGRYRAWVAEDCARLDAAWAAFLTAPGGERLRPLFSIAHDMKGQAATFGYPRTGALANRLCRLIETILADPSAPDRLDDLAALVREIGRAVREAPPGSGIRPEG